MKTLSTRLLTAALLMLVLAACANHAAFVPTSTQTNPPPLSTATVAPPTTASPTPSTEIPAPPATPSPVAMPGEYPAYPPPPAPSGGYPAPEPSRVPIPASTSTPLVALTVAPAANAISPENAAGLRLSTQVAPPSFDEIDRYWADPGYAGYFPEYPILDVVFSANGAQLAIGKAHGIYVYDLQRLKARRFIDTGNVVPRHVSFMANTNMLMVCDDLFYWPRGATFFDIPSGQRAGMIRVPPPVKEEMSTIAQLSPDGRTLVIQTGNYASLYDGVSRQPLAFWPANFPLTT